MPPRRLVLLAAGTAVLASAGTLLVIHALRPSGGGTPAGPTGGAFAYVTDKNLVVMRGDRTVAQVRRLSDAADPADYKVVWTHRGNHVAMLSDAKVRQDDTADLQLITVDVRTGVERRLPCPGCSDLTPVGPESVLVEVGSRFRVLDLDRADPDAPPEVATTVPGGSASTLVASSPDQVITARDANDRQQHLDLITVGGTDTRGLGEFASNAYLPAAVSPALAGAPATFAVAFRTNPGSCGPFPIYLFRPDGHPLETDLSNVAPNGSAMYRYGLWVDDLWWGMDGHFHAIIRSVSCTSDSLTAQPATVWRLDGSVWFAEVHDPAVMLRPLDAGTTLALVAHPCSAQDSSAGCGTGVLYREGHGQRTTVADDVLSIFTPTPGAAPARATAPSAGGVDVERKFAPFVGAWTQHGYTLTIRADRTGDIVGINAAPAAEGPGEPGPPDYRQRATLSFRVLPTGITAHVDTVVDPNPPGTWYYSPWFEPGAELPLRFNDETGVIDLGERHFCGAPGTYPWGGLCGA